MIKNLVFDIGGVIVSFNKNILQEYLGITSEDSKKLNHLIYHDKRFEKCLIGKMKQEEYQEELIKEYPSYEEEISIILGKQYQKNILPIKQDVVELLYQLHKNYNIYFLSNLTVSTYRYLKEELKIIGCFDGGIYSWQEGIKKPEKEIYNRLINQYHLRKEETIFFDDTEKNVVVGNQLGIKSIQFRTIEDIVNALK